MTKYFLEIDFEQDISDIENGLPHEIIRLAVSHEIEAKGIYDELDTKITTQPHTAYLHECNHSASGNAPCNRKIIAEVKAIL